MGRFLTLCILAGMAGLLTNGHAGDGYGEQVRKLQPGIDTLPPQFVRTVQACGVWSYVATEVRNLPDPPNAIPRETDQIDRGIASVGFMELPAPVNVRLTLLTDQSFPSTPSYKSFTFSIALVDPSKEGRAILMVRDFANNLRIDTVNIMPAAPSVSSARLDYGIVRAGTRERRFVTVRNTSVQPMVITDIRIRGNGPFTIANPPALPRTIQPAGTLEVQLDYAPVRGTTEDHGALVMESQCGNTMSELRGVVGLALLDVEDWAVGDIQAGERVCKPDGLRIVNNGNMPVTITGFDIGNPNVTLSTPTVPPLPIEVLPGAEIHVQDLCYGRATVGEDTASVRVQSDAPGDDLTCVVTGRVMATSVNEDSDVMAPWVRYVAASETLEVACEDGQARIVVVDMRGRLLHMEPITPPLMQMDARTFPAGTVIVTIDSPKGRRTVAVPILR